MAAGTTAFIALGANLGDRLETLQSAVGAIDAAAGVSVSAVSGLYETAPVGGPEAQGAYYNAVLRVSTTLQPEPLLDLLLAIEQDHARVRDVRWGPRTLDLDILLHGETHLETERLTVPHPRMHQRRFVLAPLADVGGDAQHPVLDASIADLLHALPEDDADDVVRVMETWL